VTGRSAALILSCLATLVLAGCTHDADAVVERPQAHLDGLPEQIQSHARNPHPKLRLKEERSIGDGRLFALPGFCENSAATLAIAERGHGTARHELGWYDVGGGKSNSVVRYDWTDDDTYDTFVLAMDQDQVCLGGWDEDLLISGAPTQLRKVEDSSTDRSPDRTFEGQVVLDGTILELRCARSSRDDCVRFVKEVLAALKVH